MINLKNKIFGNLFVIKDSGKRAKGGQILWECLCICGKTTCVRSDNLRNGKTKSCGKCKSPKDKIGSRLKKYSSRFFNFIIKQIDFINK